MPTWDEEHEWGDDGPSRRRRRRPNSHKPDDQEYWRYEEDDRPLPHSGFGIASSVLSLLTGAFLFVLFAIAAVIEASNPGWADNEDSPQVIVLGLLLIGGIIMAFLSGALGIVGMVQSGRNKVFAWIGVVLGFLIALGAMGLICLGLLSEM